MPIMVEKEKWILYKHTCNYDIIKAIAMDVKNSCSTVLSDTEKHRMQDRQAALNLYNTRNPSERPLDSMNHRINTLEFYMFGYEDKQANVKRFMFSPLGNLFLDKLNAPEKQKKIFITMLFAMQFEHQASGTASCFQLFPFRLIFKLLTDDRLERKLYNAEYACIIAFCKKANEQEYEKLVAEILKLRKLTNAQVAAKLKADEHTYVNAVYEWEYYTQGLLAQIGIFDLHKGDKICELYHPSKTNTKSLPTKRKATNGYVSICASEVVFIEKMLAEYSYSQTPIRLDDPERLRIDVIKEIYSFYPKLLLEEIGERIDDEQLKLLELPKLIEMYSNNPNNETAYLFEDVLTEGMNLFYNVEAKKIGGAGHTDIECLYLTKKKKFAVDAKSTENKLMGINAGRLRGHRDEIGGEYTIVITSRYVPGAKRDIKDTPNVIILANTFAEYLYNHIYADIREIDYKDFDDLIVANLGTDISKQISDLTLHRFGANCSKN